MEEKKLNRRQEGFGVAWEGQKASRGGGSPGCVVQEEKIVWTEQRQKVHPPAEMQRLIVRSCMKCAKRWTLRRSDLSRVPALGSSIYIVTSNNPCQCW